MHNELSKNMVGKKEGGKQQVRIGGKEGGRRERKKEREVNIFFFFFYIALRCV